MASVTSNHSTSFSLVSPNAALASRSPSGSPGLVIPNQGNEIEVRSDLLARLLSREFPLDELVCNVFKNPISSELSKDAFADLVPLLGEIINPSFLDQITGANKRYELHAKFLRGLAFCLNHLRLQNDCSRPSAIDSLLLFSFMPIYLASSRDKIVPAVENTMNKLRQSVCVALWLRVMDCDSGYRWLEELVCKGQVLDSVLEQNLRISMPRIAGHYWSGSLCKSQPTETDRGLWEITCQLLRGESQIHIPKSMTLGVVSWEKILQNWNSLKQALASSASGSTPDSHKIVGPVGGTCSDASLPDRIVATKSPEGVDALETKEKKSNLQAVPVPAPVSKDRRIVEIRSSSDPQLKKVLDQLLQRSRDEQSMLTLAVVSRSCVEQDRSGNWFSPMIDQIILESEAEDLKGFVTDAGELALIFYDVDRSDISHWLRESFSQLRSGNSNSIIHSEASELLIAGVAMVSAPSRSFQLEQLIDAAWRCRDGAAIQGANAVKTIEVY
jgi:hypothetical protein